jgi:hypothetical protein
MRFGEDLHVKFNWSVCSLSLSVLCIPLSLFFTELQIVHHTLNAVGDSPSTVDFESADNTPLVVDALRPFTQESSGQEIFERLNEDVFVSKVREKLYDLLQVRLELIWWRLESVFTQNIVRVSRKHFCDCVRPNLEVHEGFEARRFLNGKRLIAFEAKFKNTVKVVLHLQKVVYDLAGG